jgi:hypothetical protein
LVAGEDVIATCGIVASITRTDTDADEDLRGKFGDGYVSVTETVILYIVLTATMVENEILAAD